MAKSNNSNAFLKFIGYCYIPIFIIALVFNCWFVYYKMVLETGTWSLTANFVDDSTYNPGTFFIDVNYFSNERNNGKEVFEVKFNYYIETSIPEQNEDGTYDNKYIMSSGVQFYDTPISNYQQTYMRLFDKKIYGYVLNNHTYYAMPQGQNVGYVVSDETSIEGQDKWIWDIGGQLCLMEEVGDIQFDQEVWTKHYKTWDVNALITSLYTSIGSFEDGETITMFNFTPYLNVTKMFNAETGRMESDFSLNDIWTYVNIRVNKSSNGMVDATQSIFSSYKGDSDWTLSNTGLNSLYWDEAGVYEITDEGRLIYLKPSCKTFLEAFEDIELKVNINLDDFVDLKIVGLKQDSLDGFVIESFNITASEQQDFYIYDEFEDISTQNVNVIRGGV